MVKKYQVARLLDYNREYQTDVLLNSSGYLFNIMGFAIVSSETFMEIFCKKSFQKSDARVSSRRIILKSVLNIFVVYVPQSFIPSC